MPAPSWLRARTPSIRWNRVNRCGMSASGMPTPVSVTDSSTWLGRCCKVTVIAPVKVCLKALDTRFSTTVSHIAGSSWTGRSSCGQSTRSSRPARSNGGPEDFGQA